MGVDQESYGEFVGADQLRPAATGEPGGAQVGRVGDGGDDMGPLEWFRSRGCPTTAAL